MTRTRLIGILWILGGFVLLVHGFRSDTRDTVPVLLGALFVAVGAAMIRRSSRGRGRT